MQEVFDDSYVEQLQNFIHKIKGSREMEVRFMIFEEMLREEREEGYAEGYAEGFAEGYAEEFVKVFAEVLAEGRSVLKEPLLLCLKRFGDIPDEILEQVQSQQDMEVLKNWIQTTVRSKKLEEFARKM